LTSALNDQTEAILINHSATPIYHVLQASSLLPADSESPSKSDTKFNTSGLMRNFGTAFDNQNRLMVEEKVNVKQITVDIIQCYTNIVLKYKALFGRLDIRDRPMPFDGKFKNGLYEMVGTKPPLYGMYLTNGWYPTPWVERGLAIGYWDKSNIRSQLIPSYAIPDKFFNDLIDDVRTTMADKDNVSQGNKDAKDRKSVV
jgi:hypothetical protein